MLHKYGIKPDEIFNAIGEALVVIDNEMSIISVNRSYSELFGISPAETIGVVIRDLIDEQWNVPEICTLLEKSISIKEPFSDFLLKKKFTNLGYRVFLFKGHPFTSDRGEDYYLLSIEDITEKHKLLSELKETGTEYRETARDNSRNDESNLCKEILEFIPVGVVITDSNNEIQRINKSFTELTGISEEKVRSNKKRESIIDLLSEDEKRIEKTGNLYAGKGDAARLSSDYELMINENGKSRFFSVKQNPMFDFSGKVIGTIDIWQDITETKKVEKLFREKEQEYKTLTENIPEVIARFDRKLRHTFINDYGAKVYGIAKERIIGKTNAELGMPADKIDYWGRNFEEVFRTGKQKTINFDFKSPKLGYLYFSSILVPELNEKHETVSVLAITRDITEVRVTEDTLRSTLESISDGFFSIDKNWLFVYINSQAERLLNCRREEIIGKNIWDVFPMVNGTILESEFRRAQNGETRDFEYQFDSSEKIYHNRCFPRMDGGISVFLVDITERKRAERVFRQTENRLRVIYQSGMLGLFYWNTDGFITDANDKFLDMLGYTRQDLAFANVLWTQLTPSEYHAADEQGLAEIKETGVEKPYEKEFFRKDGTRIPVIIGAATYDDAHCEGIAFVVDISERKQIEKDIKKSEERFRAFVTASSDAIYRVSPDWKVMRMLRGRNFITDTDKPNSHWMNEYVLKDDQSKVQSAINEAVNKRGIYKLEHRVLRVDGSIGWTSSRAIPMIDENGEITEWFGTASDITERKRLEVQLRKERDLLEAIIETIPVMITVYDPQLKEIRVNRALEQITGWTNEDARKSNLMELVYPDTEYRSKVAEFMISLAPGFRDFIMSGKDREAIESSWANVRLPDGRQVGIGIDNRERKRDERELQISAERFRRITSSNIIGITMGDMDGNLIYANDYFLDVIGYNRESVVVNNISMLRQTPAEYLYLIDKANEELRKKGSALPYEKEMYRRDGSRIWVLIASMVLPGLGDMIFSFVLDISVRKKALEETQARKAEIEAILSSFPDGYVVYNRDATIRMFNNVARNILKYPQEIERSSSRRRIDFLKLSKINGQPFQIEEIPYIKALRGEFVKNMLMKFSRDNETVWISVSASPILIDNKIYGAVAQISDITELHNLQEQLTNERNFVDAILETSGALILVLDSKGSIVRFNRACEHLTGYSNSEVIDRSFFDLFILEEEKESVISVISRLFKGEPVVEHENHWSTKSGEKRFIRWRNTIIKNNQGIVTYAIATGIDISDRKTLEELLNHRAEELVSANADLESFSYSVSHDLRNPLKIIDGFSSILLEDYADRLDKEGQDYLRRISSSSKKAQTLISDILNLSRIGRQEIKRENFDISTMVRSYLNELIQNEPKRLTDLVIQDGVYAFADPKLLHVALENLLRNAWKFTSKKDVTRIELSVIQIENKDVFIIKDNGAGFDNKFAKKIFEPFKRVHNEKEFGGTGIGLSIVKRVIDRHGGQIWAEGEIGKGAAFYFSLD